jgi:hypothetical protein
VAAIVPARFKLVSEIVGDVQAELGLPVSTDPVGDTGSPISVQLCALLKALGKDLVRDYEWGHLVAENTFLTTSSTEAYAVPDGFRSLVTGTVWDRTNNMPLAAVTPQQWQALKGIEASTTNQLVFRLQDGFIYLRAGNDFAAAGLTIAYEYRSEYWARHPDGTALDPTDTQYDTDTFAASTDVLRLEPHMLTRGLKLKFLQAKGFDTTVAQDDFNRALAAARDFDTAGPVLSINGHGGTMPMLSIRNVTDGGWGA